MTFSFRALDFEKSVKAFKRIILHYSTDLKALPHVTISSTMDFNVAKIASARASSTISLRVAGP